MTQVNIDEVVAILEDNRRKLAVCVRALKAISKDYVTDNNQDCVCCDFGPVQSKTHHPECTYLVAKQALSEIGEK